LVVVHSTVCAQTVTFYTDEAAWRATVTPLVMPATPTAMATA
jgi:hypothetical protein